MVADYFGKNFKDFAIANDIRHVKTDRDNVWSIFEHVDMLYDKGSTKDFEQHFCKSSIRIHILMYHTLEIQIIQITYQHQSCISISNKIQQNSQHLGEWVYMLKTICFLKLVVISTTILISSSEKTIQCFQTITVFCIRISPSIVLFFV